MAGLGDIYRAPPRTGGELVTGDATLGDFWRWMGSDLVANATRGVFAEFLVALAVGASEGVREEWASYDVRASDGTRIEVKTSAYLQSWSQEALSRPSFDIAPRRGWDAEAGMYSSERKRWADVYVFCLHHHQDKRTVEPLDLSQWTFFVLATDVLNEKARGQKTIGLARLGELGARKVRFEGIAAAVRDAAPSTGDRVS